MTAVSATTGFAGELIRPGDVAYDEARRVWNGMIDRRPRLIARCRESTDVAAALRLARDRGLPLAVRGGGHHVAGGAVCDGGVVIDLSELRHVTVAREVVRVAAGARLADLDAATHPRGLAVPAGIVSTTGVAGLTLGGGLGWLQRRHGLTCDRLVSVDAVLADGTPVRADEHQHSELFWALRGGGGLAVVTRFDFRPVALPTEVVCGLVLYPLEAGSEVLRGYREAAAAASHEVTTIVLLRRLPAVPAFPPRLHGRHAVAVGVCCTAPVQHALRLIAPLRDLGEPLLDTIAPKPLAVHQQILDASQPAGRRYYWRSLNLAALADDVVDALVELGGTLSSRHSLIGLFQGGGQIAAVPDRDSAYPGREALFVCNLATSWEDAGEDARHVAWTRRAYERLRPHAAAGAYLNFTADGVSREDAYGARRLARLEAVRRRYDPHGVLAEHRSALEGGRAG